MQTVAHNATHVNYRETPRALGSAGGLGVVGGGGVLPRFPGHIHRVFGSVDKVGKFTVFDIGGNKYRLIAAIHYNRKKVYIRQVLTHAEYNRDRWKE